MWRLRRVEWYGPRKSRLQMGQVAMPGPDGGVTMPTSPARAAISPCNNRKALSPSCGLYNVHSTSLQKPKTATLNHTAFQLLHISVTLITSAKIFHGLFVLKCNTAPASGGCSACIHLMAYKTHLYFGSLSLKRSNTNKKKWYLRFLFLPILRQPECPVNP